MGLSRSIGARIMASKGRQTRLEKASTFIKAGDPLFFKQGVRPNLNCYSLLKGLAG